MRQFMCFNCGCTYESKVIYERDAQCPNCNNTNFSSYGEPIMATDSLSHCYYLISKEKNNKNFKTFLWGEKNE